MPAAYRHARRRIEAAIVARLTEWRAAGRAALDSLDGGMGAVVTVEHLRKAYGPVVAVDEVSFAVEEGEIFGLLGPNLHHAVPLTYVVRLLQGPWLGDGWGWPMPASWPPGAWSPDCWRRAGSGGSEFEAADAAGSRQTHPLADPPQPWGVADLPAGRASLPFGVPVVLVGEGVVVGA